MYLSRSHLKQLLKLGAIAAVTMVSSSAFAGMLGTTLQVRGCDPNTSTCTANFSVVVGAGVEIPVGGLDGFSAHAIDFGDTTIAFISGINGTFLNNPFNGFIVADGFNNLGAILSVTTDSSGYPGFAANGTVNFDANSITVDFSGVTARIDDRLLLTVAVPEPGTAALIGLGFLAGGILLRRRRPA
jgi:hypothetical protein